MKNIFKNTIYKQKIITKLLLRDEVKLNLGCGKDLKKGWINIDSAEQFKNSSDLELTYNLAKGIPFPDNSVDFIYHEHLIEHLNASDGAKLTTECYRVLKPNAIIRLACPDLDDLIQTYLDDAFDSKDWVKTICPHLVGKSRGEVFNISVREWGHKYIYNADDLISLLCSAGFPLSKIFKKNILESGIYELKGLETRKDSIVFEAKK